MTDIFTVQAGVREPWRRFIDDIVPLRPDLFRYCCGLTGNVWDGEDLVQDTLLRVFGLLGKTNADIAHPRAYLVRAATHLWIDRVRRAGIEDRHAKANPVDEAAPDDPAQIAFVRDAASSLFLHLAPQERAAVLLKDVLDFTLEETAAMLQTTIGAIKAALHRGRTRLKAAHAAPVVKSNVPRELIDRFVAALTAKDFDAIRALCLADVRIDMVGGISAESYEQGKMVFEHAHFVMPQFGMHPNPRWETALYRGEPVALGFRTQDGVEGLNEIWRFEMGDGGVAKVRLYCFSPNVIKQVAADLGLHALDRRYRSPP